MKTVCLHGAESTGKSVLCERFLVTRGWPYVPEYGRLYCEQRGTDLTMVDLMAIAQGQSRMTAHALATATADGAPVLLLDTDQLMTAAWAQMLFGDIPEPLFAYPKADLYLMFEADVPWREDGTRFFGAEDARARFAGLAAEMLARTGVPVVRIAGSWEEREAQALAAVERLLDSGV